MLISVVVRSHEYENRWILRNALESLSAQTHKELEIVLVLQNHTAEQRDALDSELQGLFNQEGRSYKIVCIAQQGDKDLRSLALNEGFKASNGSAIAILDYDDVMYPNAYERMSKVLEDTQVGCVVGSVRLVYVSYNHQSRDIELDSRGMFFQDRPSRSRLLHNSFTPLHSLLFNKAKLNGICFPEDMLIFEDYSFLLRLAAKEEFDFSLFDGNPICEYRVPEIMGTSISGLLRANPALYKEHRKKIWKLRKTLGFTTSFFMLSHPFYYPFKTKLARFFWKLNSKH